jgi:hypothetical protein
MFYKVNLIDYIPEFLQEIREFQVILSSESEEINRLTDGMKVNMENSYIATMDATSISRFEKFLGVVPEGTLEQRRKYLLALIQSKDKLSEKTIKMIVNTLMSSECYIKFYAGDEPLNPNPHQGTLIVRVLAPDASSTDYRFENVARAILPLMPSHIQLNVEKFFTTWEDIMIKNASWQQINDDFSSWEDVKNYLPPL